MFVNRKGPSDYSFPEDIAAAGYVLNEQGQIRKADNPRQGFWYRVSNSDRFNDVKYEAMTVAVRRKVHQCLRALGMHGLRLQSGDEGQHTTILTNTRGRMNQKRVIVIVTDHRTELGLLSTAAVYKDSITVGSLVNLVRAVNGTTAEDLDTYPEHLFESGGEAETKRATNSSTNEGRSAFTPDTGLIVLNPAQIFFSFKNDRPLSYRAWEALPRDSAVHPAPVILPVNRIKGMEDMDAHINYVLENVVFSDQVVDPEAKVDFIGVQDGGEAVLKWLNNHWDKVHHRVGAIALCAPVEYPAIITNADFQQFLVDRARGWVLTSVPKDLVVNAPAHAIPEPDKSMFKPYNPRTDRQDTFTDSAEADKEDADEHWGATEVEGNTELPVYYPTISSGLDDNQPDEILCYLYSDVLSWLQNVAQAGDRYRNVPFKFGDDAPILDSAFALAMRNLSDEKIKTMTRREVVSMVLTDM